MTATTTSTTRSPAVAEGPGFAAGGPGELDHDGDVRLDPEAGLATAEYAIATIAAVGFAGLLIAVLKSDSVRGLLENIVTSALSI